MKKYANNRIDEVANLYGPGLAAQYAGKEGWQPIEPGDVCWEDINGDGVINGYDRQVVTNTDTDLPAFYYADQLSKKNITRSNNGLTAIDNNSSRFYEKGDYLALRELTLNYNLPKTWISKVGMTDASVYVTGQNLFYITGYTGVSPEPAVDTTYGRGIDNGRYPTPRTVLFGLSVTF